MKRLTIAALILALLPTATAVADDQECMTADITWEETVPGYMSPSLRNHHYGTGIRTAKVGHHLWVQYDTTGNYLDDEDNPILSLDIVFDAIAVEACPGGLVTLIFPPAQSDDAELGPAVVVIDVIAYWEQYLSHNFGP